MNKHHTMLIHITRLKDEQQEWKDLVEELEIWKEKSYSTLGNLGSNFRKKIKKRWRKNFYLNMTMMKHGMRSRKS